ncbi:MAG: tRNA (guanosine(18)-2'-O)-methyltransferase TrmH [Pseudomonadales bacterium]|jgi:tRNA (guanosine-2'-O-)-methyltransferase|nr:tRNA (guanosine(18)-2'-O)-methyltransferase TrmH [Pseudomonadales bacterium]
MTPERARRIRSVLDRRQPDLRIVTDAVHKGHNLSAIVRSCDAFGVLWMHAVVNDRDFRTFRSTAMGSQRWVEIRRHAAIGDALEPLRGQGFQVVVAHLSPDAVDFRAVDYTRPTAILMGAEKQGPSDAALARADQAVTIPMVGMVESFNVSVATAILLAEAHRQRAEAGFYDAPRLDPETWRRLFFEWGEPRLADFCQRHALAYPEIDTETGELLDPGWFARRQAEIAAAR